MKTRASSFTVLSTNKRPHSHSKSGFTIVELLIVIVVIAILAAITIVAHNGVQQRANNTAIIDAAGKTIRMIQSYVAANGTYPSTTNPFCITTTSGCNRASATPLGSSPLFDTNIATVGTVPRSVPMTAGTRQGIAYLYDSTRTVDGTASPVLIAYYLFGTAQPCGMPSVVNSDGTVLSTIGAQAYTISAPGGSNLTYCALSIAGPST